MEGKGKGDEGGGGSCRLPVLLFSGVCVRVCHVEVRSTRTSTCKCFWKCYTPCINNDHQPPPVCKIRCGGKYIFPYGVSGASPAAATRHAERSALPLSDAARPTPQQAVIVVRIDATTYVLALGWLAFI
jgi:hypothetical protein